MDESPPKLVQDPSLFNPFTYSKDDQQKAKGLSFLAFVFSIFLYSCAFYIFNLSPPKLFNDSKFWFFISNTLIIILALDYGAFSSSSKPNRDDLYAKYITTSQINLPSYISRTIIPEENVEDFREKELVKRKNLINPQKDLVFVPEKPRRSLSLPGNGGPLDDDNNEEKVKKVEVRTMQRSKSDGSKRVTFDESRNTIRRVETEKLERSSWDKTEARYKVNDYAMMSDEELNRRVEDFIQRCNRQIRLQNDVYSKSWSSDRIFRA
ncbi:hypothetical protein K2173_005597 [Erythroxylum novogranatense]|uniref:Uncharacterized protein n=1 Tax=Erythroxylum novogranatense TaxID=1862640 RepID=A0AAV8T535_9ROSI|nr:hypothetical protein K2173_005597 [Erythroxylum novogranatense]